MKDNTSVMESPGEEIIEGKRNKQHMCTMRLEYDGSLGTGLPYSFSG
jgi:hypothetical protein